MSIKSLQGGYEKNRNFRPISHFISKMIQNKAIVTIMYFYLTNKDDDDDDELLWNVNRKPYPSF